MNRVANDQERDSILDGLRAIAILLVLLWHWAEWHVGYLGVQIFFVLSGFLITRILFAARLRSEITSSRPREIGTFIVRRSLRIFPIYYLLLISILVHRHFQFREDLPWHFTYLSNVFFFRAGAFAGPLSHLWSLSVEEQFYLFWPWLLLFCPKRWFPWILCCLIVSGPITRAVLFGSGMHNYASFNTLPFSNFDGLGFGAFIAWAHEAQTEKMRDIARMIGWLAIPSGIVFLAVASLPENLFSVAAIQLTLSGLIAGIIEISQWNWGRRLLMVLGLWPLAYLGRISYGIYLYHVFAGSVVAWLSGLSLAPNLARPGVLSFFLMFTITVLGATLSWFAIERPILALRSRFSVARTASRSQRSVTGDSALPMAPQ